MSETYVVRVVIAVRLGHGLRDTYYITIITVIETLSILYYVMLMLLFKSSDK